ncbi:MAG: glycerol-3-phosphate 1-O-acyltransferase PlsB [Pseudomonadaceae bacterium]|nr:glycerol-3-phosphate 1-O-acyltransferase PlsB [Pseudomonadaceae bacterium]
MFAYLKHLNYRLLRRILTWIIRPTAPTPVTLDGRHVYVLEYRSLTDLLVLDIICEQLELPSPLSALAEADLPNQRRVISLSRGHGLVFARNTMRAMSPGLTRLLDYSDSAKDEILLTPTSVFWGRAPRRESSIWKAFVSEQWTVTGRFRRMLGVVLNRKDILVEFGEPLSLTAIGQEAELSPSRALRRVARLLRVRFRNQRVAAMGPDFSHRRVLLHRIVKSRAVREVINKEADIRDQRKLERRARRYTRRIASHMSYPTIRVLERLLTFFWNRVYSGIDVSGLPEVKRIAQTHTLIYLPSHRSHFDYLLLSYLLFHEGLNIPHIAAGDNLNMPVVGALLRRGGAFFMRRRFRGDPLYSAVFSEYLYQVYRSGHSVEFFIEGGRTRTGRLLPAKTGLLSMTIDHHNRGLPRPIALVPVYFGYERLMEARSYLDELRGAAKTKESLTDVFSSLRLLKENFGKVQVNFGAPVDLSDALESLPAGPDASQAHRLGNYLLGSINSIASVNPINLTALVTLATPRIAIDHGRLHGQLRRYLSLLKAHQEHWAIRPTESADNPDAVIEYAQSLGMLDAEDHSFGRVYSHEPVDAVLMTWFRNNVLHVFAIPSMIACMFINRRRGLSESELTALISNVFPYVGRELHVTEPLESALPIWIEHLVAEGLLKRGSGGRLSLPGADEAEFDAMRLLASIVMPILERQYILIALLVDNPMRLNPLTQADLLSACQQAARRISRLYGINAPEFFDGRLFREFCSALTRDGLIHVDDNDHLSPDPLLAQATRAAQWVLDTGIRQTVLAIHSLQPPVVAEQSASQAKG